MYESTNVDMGFASEMEILVILGFENDANDMEIAIVIDTVIDYANLDDGG